MANHNLDTIRHSCAHLMAQSIQKLWPDLKIQFGIGPTIDSGFYYDIDMDHSLNEADLKKIEKMMKEIIKKKMPVEKEVMSRNDAINFFRERGQNFKVELISSIPDDQEISCYKQGEFIDLCRGPHVENTGDIPFCFKLLNTAGAYWRGNSQNKMLQRIYAACFLNKEDLKKHLFFIEEAKKRDHRKLGTELQLFHFDKAAPGSPFFMPKGATIYNLLIDYMRGVYKIFDYKEVITPQILDSELWHTSGHYQHYKENMYFSNIDEREYAVKPMNCPCHMLMYKHYKYSYRDLPLRYADFGRIHRYEKAGAIGGLTRVRTFCQDDAHIFTPIDGIQNEIQNLMNMFFVCYKHFGFKDIIVNLSTRPEKKSGDDATWDKAENALKMALEANQIKYIINEGDGAFYGPKIDLEISDALNRYHQLGTIQLDFQLPERFDLNFINKDGESKRPVVIHRALLGSIERFIGVYIEHVAGAFPFWLAPEQACIIPVNNEHHLHYAKKIYQRLKDNGLRIKLDDRNESLGKKTRETQKSKIPFMIVIGDNEIKDDSISLRAYGERESITLSTDDLIKKFKELDELKKPKGFNEV